jgi:hypothetical protein
MRAKLFASMIFIVATALMAPSLSAYAAVQARDPDVPFPLALEMPFPWDSIEGVWEAHGNGVDALFSFEVLQNGPVDRKILKVVHIDPLSGQVVAEGGGVSFDNDKMVRAGMTGVSGTYMLFIRAFKNPKVTRGSNVATVLTVRAFTSSETESDVHVIIRKISSQPCCKKFDSGAGLGN